MLSTRTPWVEFDFVRFYSPDPKSGFNDFRSAMKSLAIIALVMGFYAYIKFSTNGDRVLAGLIAIFLIVQVVSLLQHYKEISASNLLFEIVAIVIPLSFLLGHRSLTNSPSVFMLALLLYRPEYMREGNRFIALLLTAMIAAVALPITCGLVVDASLLEYLSWTFLVLVVLLWMSSLPASVLRWIRD